MAKERPILFSGPMVRAILDGRKTQTRRILKPSKAQSVWLSMALLKKAVLNRVLPGGAQFDFPNNYGPLTFIKCPYGKPGDRLWVRETLEWDYAEGIGPVFSYAAGKGPYIIPDGRLKRPKHNVTPSIHMPRWASRITLEITDIRVERLQDISEEDARAEGYPDFGCGDMPHPISWFECLWSSINGLASWDANQWVWVIEFKKEAAE